LGTGSRGPCYVRQLPAMLLGKAIWIGGLARLTLRGHWSVIAVYVVLRGPRGFLYVCLTTRSLPCSHPPLRRFFAPDTRQAVCSRRIDPHTSYHPQTHRRAAAQQSRTPSPLLTFTSFLWVSVSGGNAPTPQPPTIPSPHPECVPRFGSCVPLRARGVLRPSDSVISSKACSNRTVTNVACMRHRVGLPVTIT